MKNFSDLSVLVTGGNGAVGCNLVNKLLKLNAKVVVLDDFSQSGPRNLASNKNLKIIRGNITNKKIIAKVFSHNFDYVFHLAARFANELSVKDPYEDLRVNVEGTLHVLLHAARKKFEDFCIRHHHQYMVHKKQHLLTKIKLHIHQHHMLLANFQQNIIAMLSRNFMV